MTQASADSSVPITIQGQEYRLRFDMNALVTLDRVFGITVDAFPKLREQAMTEVDRIEFAMKLAFAMTRTLHPELTLQQVGGMSLAEMAVAPALLNRAIALGREGPLGKEQAANPKPAVESVSRGTGAKRSSRRLAAAG